MSKALQRKKMWKQVAHRSVTYYDHDKIEDMLADLQKIADAYPGARVNTYEEYGSTVMSFEIEREETDAELKRREEAEVAGLARKRAQLAALKKELGED
jgi:hypothetical protein